MRRADVQGVVYFHAHGRRTIAHGGWDGYRWAEDPDGVWLESGPSLPARVWRKIRNAMYRDRMAALLGL